jgi:hypothetical protein
MSHNLVGRPKQPRVWTQAKRLRTIRDRVVRGGIREGQMLRMCCADGGGRFQRRRPRFRGPRPGETRLVVPRRGDRNYARNYAEATERLTGGTERLSEIGVTVHPVTEDRVGDWLRFLDHDAFAGNPDWASCYCLEPHLPATPELPERAWRDTRRPWPVDFGAARLSGISRTLTADP